MFVVFALHAGRAAIARASPAIGATAARAVPQLGRLMSSGGLPLTHGARDVLMEAQAQAHSNANPAVTPLHVALALAEGAGDGYLPSLLSTVAADRGRLVTALRGRLAALPRQHPPVELSKLAADAQLASLLANADTVRRRASETHVAVDHVVAATTTDPALKAAYAEAGIATDALLAAIKTVRGDKKVQSEHDDVAGEPLKTLKKYATDLVTRAEDGKLDPVIGREDEIRRVSGGGGEKGGCVKSGDFGCPPAGDSSPHATHQEQPRPGRPARRGENVHR